MLETILSWLATFILNYLWSKAAKELVTHAEQVALDEKRGARDEANVAAYAQAKSREERARAALDLLNRRTPSN